MALTLTILSSNALAGNNTYRLTTSTDGLDIAAGTTSGDSFNSRGFDSSGIHKDTGTNLDHDSYVADGFNDLDWNSQAIHKDTGTIFDADGYDIDEFAANGAGKEACHDNSDYSYSVKYSVSYAASNSEGITRRTYYYRYPNMGGTVRSGNGNYSNYGIFQGGYGMPRDDNRWGYKKSGSERYTRKNSSGYDYQYGICKKRLNR
jgi:hypothetical protein